MMTHLTLELVLWMLLAFFVGCIIGCLARRLFAGADAEPAAPGAPAPAPDPRPAPEAATTPMPVTVRPAPAPVDTPRPPAAAMQAQPLAAAAPVTSAVPRARKPRATGRPARPAGIEAPRGGVADTLQQISGVGPKIERTLNGLGVYHFDQIAAWTPDEVAWADAHLKFRGRIVREEWIEQARLLAAGDLARFRRLYGTGGLKDRRTGQTRSGTRTRRS